MTIVGALPGPIPGRPSGGQRKFATTSQTRYIAPISGKDTNTGLAGSPWKTWGRYLDFVGPAYIDDGAIHTLLYLEDAPASDPILPPNVGSAGAMFIQADTSAIVTLRASSFTAVQLPVPATNTPYEISDGALDWTPYVQKQILDVRTNALAWVMKNVGGGSARNSIPAGGFGAGDDYQIRSIPKIGAIKFTNSVVAGGTITISNLEFVDGCIVPRLGFIDVVGNSAVAFDQCHLGGSTGRPMQGYYSASSCIIVDPSWVGSPVLNNVGILGLNTVVAFATDGSFISMNSCNIQDAILLIEHAAVFADSLAIFDSPDVGTQLDQNGSLEVISDLYGAGNASFGALIYTGGSQITWQNAAPTLTGAAGQVSVGGAVPTWAGTPIDVFGAVAAQSL